MQGQQPANQFGFAATPEVVRRVGNYRDPYRELVKMAPQNIMHDRRVVRGNTFAAIVIPVNMQPDPMLIEKQREEQMRKKQRLELLRKRKEEDENMKAEYEEQQMNLEDQAEYMPENEWEHLEGHIENERELEPDYFVNRPPTPVFIPNPEGEDKHTQIEEGELFDYDLEVEPLLQVLIGKSVEAARIELLEEFEADSLKKHKEKYRQLREAELMETQRVEAARLRRTQENQRRDLQELTAKNQRLYAERKLASRLAAKDILNNLRGKTLRILQDQGVLRDALDTALYVEFLPIVYNQTREFLVLEHDIQEGVDGLLASGIFQTMNAHKDSIKKEHQRKENNKREAERLQKEKEELKRKIREQKAAAREAARIEALKEKIQSEFVAAGALAPTTFDPLQPPVLRLYDFRDSDGGRDGIFTMGGLVGELIMTLSVVGDYILSNPANQKFSFNQQNVYNLLRDLIVKLNLPDQAIILISSLSEEEKQFLASPDVTMDQKIDTLSKKLSELESTGGAGLRYIFEHYRELGLNRAFTELFLRSIVKILYLAPKELIPIEEIDPTLEEEEKQRKEKEDEETKKKNDEIETANKESEALRAKVVLKPRQDEAKKNECAVIKIKTSKVMEGPDTDKQVEVERIRLVDCKNAAGIEFYVLHKGLQANLRRRIIQIAKSHFKEAESANIDLLLSLIDEKSQRVENELITDIVSRQKFDETKPLPVFEFDSIQ